MTAFLRRRSLNRGSPSTIVTAFLDSLLTTRGQIIRRGASAPEALAAQTADTFVGGDGTDVTTRTAAQVRASLSLVTGSYTPTLTIDSNITGTTAYPAFYVRVNNQVIVSMYFEAQPTSAAYCYLYASLPVASTMNAYGDQLSGAGVDAAGTGVNFFNESSGGRASIVWLAPGTTNAGISSIFMYPVL